MDHAFKNTSYPQLNLIFRIIKIRINKYNQMMA